MSYTYEQRRAPKVRQEAKPERNPEQELALPVMMGGPAAPGGPDAPNPGLDAVMQARMRSTFGDLSALRDWQPPIPETAPPPTEPYTGPVTHTLSDAAPSPAAAGPMQAKREDENAGAQIQASPNLTSPRISAPEPSLPPAGRLTAPVSRQMQPSPNLISPQIITPDQGGVLTTDQSKIDHTKDLTMNYIMGSSNAGESSSRSPGDEDAEQRIIARLEEKYGSASLDKLHRPANPGEAEGVEISGLMAGRVLHGLMNDRGRGFHMDEEEAFQLMDDLLAPHKQGMTPEEQKAANDRFDTGMNRYKGILMDDLKHKEKQFGALVTQMHPEDVLPQIGQQTLGQDDPFLQDTIQFRQMGGKYLDPGNREDQKFIDLAEYYNNTAMALIQYKMMAHGGEKSPFAGVSPDTMLNDDNEYVRGIREREDRIEGPRMNPEQLAEYRKDLKKRAKTESYLKNRLFGRFKK